jgi:putative oxidoreductase
MGVKQFFSNLNIDRIDPGLLIIRLIVGLSMVIFHGYGKLTGGTETWEWLGGRMDTFGLGFAPAFWGFMSMVAEFFGAIAIILGVLFRPAAAILAINMIVAVSHHLTLPPDNQMSGLSGASHAIELTAIFIGLFLTGPGKYSLSSLWSKNGKPEM